jgi:hypothetical protein
LREALASSLWSRISGQFGARQARVRHAPGRL